MKVAAFPVPDHVPADLVIDHVFDEQKGVYADPYTANVKVFDLPPIFYSPGGNYDQGQSGVWVVTRVEILREIYMSPERFSSKGAIGSLSLAGLTVPLLPNETDPPEHSGYRNILNRFLTPARLQSLEAELTRDADMLIDRILDKGRCEFAHDFGTPFPVAIFLKMMRLPTEHLYEFVSWVDGIFHPDTMETHLWAINRVLDYMRGTIAERKKDPGDDLLSTIIRGTVDGRPLSDQEILSMGFLLFQGGLDTVAATLKFIFKHLAENQENQALLRSEPQLIANSVEEFLRAFPVSPSLRMVKEDLEFHGVPMKKGDRILLATPISGRDPAAYADPDTIDLRRAPTRHLAFATGVHTCAGNALARREIRIALECWIKRVPAFRLDENDPPIAHAQLVWSIDKLPLVWS